jgi:hypothetical protein
MEQDLCLLVGVRSVEFVNEAEPTPVTSRPVLPVPAFTLSNCNSRFKTSPRLVPFLAPIWALSAA